MASKGDGRKEMNGKGEKIRGKERKEGERREKKGKGEKRRGKERK